MNHNFSCKSVPVAFIAKIIYEGLELGNYFVQNSSNVEWSQSVNYYSSECDEVYKDLIKNSKQMLITYFIIKSSQDGDISTSDFKSA